MNTKISEFYNYIKKAKPFMEKMKMEFGWYVNKKQEVLGAYGGTI